MEFIILLQSTRASLALEFVRSTFPITITIIYILAASVAVSTEYLFGDTQEARKKMLNMLLGAALGGGIAYLLRDKEIGFDVWDIQGIKSSIYWILMAVATGTMLFLISRIYNKSRKKEISYQVIPHITKNGVEDGFLLIERYSSFIFLFGKEFFSKVKQERKLGYFASMDEAVGALEEMQSMGYLKSVVAIATHVPTVPQIDRGFRLPYAKTSKNDSIS